MIRNLFLSTALVVLAGCSGEGPRDAADAPGNHQLPQDVEAVAPTSAASGTQVVQAADRATQTGAPAGSTSEAILDSSTISATGEFVSPARSELAAKMPGRVSAILVQEGARVSRGQPVLQMESDYSRLEAQRAQAELSRATAAAEDARRDFERKKELKAKDSIPQATYDRSQAMYEQAGAARSVAASSLSLSRQRVADATLRSPINGVVAERRTDVGQHLGDASIAFVIIQTAPLKLRYNLPERFIGQVRQGQPVVASVDPYPGEKFRGTVKAVGGVIDPSTRTFFAEAEFPNRDGRLRPGLFARIEMELR